MHAFLDFYKTVPDFWALLFRAAPLLVEKRCRSAGVMLLTLGKDLRSRSR